MSSSETDKPYNVTGLKRVLNACVFSLEGIASTLKHEEAFRQEMILTALLVPLALVLPVSALAKVALIAVLFGVLIVELLNTAVEVTVNYISTSNHPLAKRAKDMGSGAVFLSLLNAVVVWTIILSGNWADITGWLQAGF
ncbi:MAG: diacylglycerol kinase [Opitutales bacterium]